MGFHIVQPKSISMQMSYQQFFVVVLVVQNNVKMHLRKLGAHNLKDLCTFFCWLRRWAKRKNTLTNYTADDSVQSNFIQALNRSIPTAVRKPLASHIRPFTSGKLLNSFFSHGYQMGYASSSKHHQQQRKTQIIVIILIIA